MKILFKRHFDATPAIGFKAAEPVKARRVLDTTVALSLALGACAWLPAAWATDVAVVGLFPNKAVVVVGGAGPKTLSVGQTFGGATLVSVQPGAATFQVDGGRRSIALGEAHVGAGTSGHSSAQLITDERGQMIAQGQINGQSVLFIVDTGASVVALSSNDAKRLGINYLAGQRARMATANGVANAWRVHLDSVGVGAITISGVDAVVLENQATPPLLGMSFLNRVDMHREGTVMTLTQRY